MVEIHRLQLHPDLFSWKTNFMTVVCFLRNSSIHKRSQKFARTNCYDILSQSHYGDSAFAHE